jgi:hypothetical protein
LSYTTHEAIGASPMVWLMSKHSMRAIGASGPAPRNSCRAATRTSWVACVASRWPSASEALRRAMSSQVRDSPTGRETTFTGCPAMPESTASISGGVSSWSHTTRPGIGCTA